MANEVERIDRINRAKELRLQGIEEGGEEQRESISGDQEARGVFRSGQTLKRIGRQERGQLREQSIAKLGAEEAVADVRNAGIEAALGREQSGGELLANLALRQGEEVGGTTLSPADQIALQSSVPQLSPLPTSTTSTSLATQRLNGGAGGDYRRRTGRQQEF
jgi:hypothetical protein